MPKPKFEQVHKVELTYAQLKSAYDIQAYIEAGIKAQQAQLERLLVNAFERDLWPVSVYEPDTRKMIVYQRPGFWLRWRLRWALWRKKRKEKA